MLIPDNKGSLGTSPLSHGKLTIGNLKSSRLSFKDVAHSIGANSIVLRGSLFFYDFIKRWLYFNGKNLHKLLAKCLIYSLVQI